MAVLSDPDRVIVHRLVMAALDRLATSIGCLKADIRAAVNAADDWADSNAGSFNTALPTAFKNAANASQKALLLAYICLRRAGL